MRYESFELDSTPSDESCLQVGKASQEALSAEARRFKHALQEYWSSHPDYESVEIVVKRNPHEFGTYFNVEIRYNNGRGASLAAAIESDSPKTWEELEGDKFEGDSPMGRVEDCLCWDELLDMAEDGDLEF